jgi:hypothetical protein
MLKWHFCHCSTALCPFRQPQIPTRDIPWYTIGFCRKENPKAFVLHQEEETTALHDEGDISQRPDTRAPGTKERVEWHIQVIPHRERDSS